MQIINNGGVKVDGWILVAAFRSPIDVTANDGRVYFRVTMDQTILHKASRDLQDGTSFIATWVLIATWHKVTYYLGNTTTPVRTPMLANSSPP